MKPYKHQEQILELSKTQDNLALLCDMGTGKTLSAIMILMDKYIKEERLMRTLILGPTGVLYNWRNEILRFTNTIADNQIGVLTAKERKKECNSNIRITNYEALIKKDFVQQLLAFKPEILICDESHLLKSPSAKRSKATEAISRSCKYKFILTGTPIAKNAMDLFQQFLILDGGKTLGRSFTVFRSTYFVDANAKWAGKQSYFPNWIPLPSMYPSLLERIYKSSFRVDKKECLDLPERIELERLVQLSDEQKAMYKILKEEFIAFVSEQHANGQQKAVVAQLAITKSIRLRQLVSGFVVLDDNTVKIFDKNPRLDELEEVLEQLCPTHKVIIWCVFKEEYKMIGKLLAKMDLNHVQLTGDIGSEDKQLNIDAFNNDPNVHVMLANRKAGGVGVNLTAAAYSINYSKTFSLIEELQSKDRNYRGGSEIHEKIVNITITTEKTLDEEVAKAIREKKNISDIVLEWSKK